MRQLSSELQDRKLRFDGVSVVSPEQVARCILLGVPPRSLRTMSENWELEQFNLNVPDEDQIKADGDPITLDLSWRLPKKYQDLDVDAHIDGLILKRLEQTIDPAERFDILERVAAELAEIKRAGMADFVRTIIYVLDVFRENDVMWGVGRGSSCASYVLFILGLHVVDCIKFKVPMTEFFHD